MVSKSLQLTSRGLAFEVNCNEDAVFPFSGGGYSNLDPPCNYPHYEIYRMVRKVKKVFPLLKL